MNARQYVSPEQLYTLLLDQPLDGVIEQANIGLTWTYCQVEQQLGLAMSLAKPTRTLPWSGTLRGKPVRELANWITKWNCHESNIAMAAINASVNAGSELLQNAEAVDNDAPANLSVFEYFLPRLVNKKVVVIGRYPGLDHYAKLCDMKVIERLPGDNDYPDPAAEFLIPEADWVFLTASSIPNKTFPRLAALAADSNLVLMGPTVPWLSELSEFGVDFIAGVKVTDRELLKHTIAEGGGTRIFETGVQYHVADLGQKEMQSCKAIISELYGKREALKNEMDTWYNNASSGRFPRFNELQEIEKTLSQYDSRYKRLWDAREGQTSV